MGGKPSSWADGGTQHPSYNVSSRLVSAKRTKALGSMQEKGTSGLMKATEARTEEQDETSGPSSALSRTRWPGRFIGIAH